VCTGDNVVLEVCSAGTCSGTSPNGNSYSASYVNVSNEHDNDIAYIDACTDIV